jgi:tRNA modification GTPase
MEKQETIAAIATAAGRAAIGIIRVAGPDLEHFAHVLTGRTLPPRAAVLTPFLDRDGEAIDNGIAMFFPAPRSYTGEDVLELQGHGGPVVLRFVLHRCVELGARVAEPGEFTRRAFLNGKLDLAQAESVIDLIDATTAEAARCAMRSLRGDFSARIGDLSATLIELRAFVEAALDFPEDDIDKVDRRAMHARLKQLLSECEAIHAAAKQGSVLREGLRAVIAGQPNVGKSSLLNMLAGEEIAIVTPIPGTTRDIVRQTIDLSGVPLHVLDTAGLRPTEDAVEQIGVQRAHAAIRDADVVLVVHDASGPGVSAPRGLPVAEARQVHVLNKIDLVPRNAALGEVEGSPAVWLSARTGEGIDLLRAELRRLAGAHSHTETVFLARERHIAALSKATSHLETAAIRMDRPELCAEELRLAHRELGSITGQFTPDDLLGEIFGRFCIGK